MALLAHQTIAQAGTIITPQAASASGDSCRVEPDAWVELTNTSGSARTVTFDGDPAGWIVREVFPAGDLAAHWSQGWDTDPAKWDRISIVEGHVTIPDPDDGPIGTDPGYDPENPNSGARACMFRDFGAGYEDDIEVSVVWTGRRPVEATPLLHVDLAVSEGGVGCWPVGDVYPGTPGFQPAALFGYVGADPDAFEVVESASLAAFPTGYPVTITLRSTGDEVTAWFDGTQVCDPVPVPAGLIGSSVHGIALDHNQLDGNQGAGGTRPASFPGCRAPFTIAKYEADATSADWSVTVPDGATVRVGPVTAARFDQPAGVVSWRYDDHTDVDVAAVRLPTPR